MKSTVPFLFVISLFLLLIACQRQIVCLHNGICANNECNCVGLYSGDHCETCNCQNGGTCNEAGNACTCPPGYGGPLCQTKSCEYIVCQQPGTDTCESGVCKCKPFFSGTFCEIDNRPDCMKYHTGKITIWNRNFTSNRRAIYIQSTFMGDLKYNESLTVDRPIGTYYIEWKAYAGSIVIPTPMWDTYVHLTECAEESRTNIL